MKSIDTGIVLPEDLSHLSDKELISIKESKQKIKRYLKRQIDYLDTDILFIKEQLRKRKE